MSLKEYLLPDETIFDECEEGNYSFYSTNKRIIKYKKGGRMFDNEVMHDISYKEITGLSLMEKRGHIKYAAIGAAMVILFVVVYYQYDYVRFVENVDYLIMLDGIVGLILLLYGVFYKRKWFEFKGPGLLQNENESKIWRLKEVKNPDVRAFVKTVRIQLDTRE